MTYYTIEIMEPEWVIENEIKQGSNQTQIALTYAFAIRKHLNPNAVAKVDWPRIHAAIEKRWSPAAVNRVKVKAWKLVEAKQKETQCPN